MRRRFSGVASAAVLLLFCASFAFGERAIFVLRHAEKQSPSDDRSVLLSEAGRARARRLADLLRDTGVTAIFSTDTERTRATVEPLARALKLEVQLYTPRDEHGQLSPQLLIKRLPADGVVLVVGHSNTVPDLLRALGVTEEIRIGPDEYDNLFLVVPRKEGPVFLRLRFY